MDGSYGSRASTDVTVKVERLSMRFDFIRAGVDRAVPSANVDARPSVRVSATKEGILTESR